MERDRGGVRRKKEGRRRRGREARRERRAEEEEEARDGREREESAVGRGRRPIRNVLCGIHSSRSATSLVQMSGRSRGINDPQIK